MKHRITTCLAATVFALGMVCDEGNAGKIADDGCNFHDGDGRNWIRARAL